MDRAARLIRNHKASRQLLTDDEIARAMWPEVAGKSVAAHTACTKLVRTTLIIEVEDAIWQKQLYAIRAQILARLHKLTGSDAIQELEFRIGIPRRPPQLAASRDRTAPQPMTAPDDESDQIQDPLLKKLYRRSRKRATA